MMKPTFSHSASLLRAVLLLGALTFVNEQQTAEAQPVSITSEMPDAFETIDIDKTSIVGNGEYYFIQFYHEEVYSPYLYQSFLGEKGEGQTMQAMDYMPFASNRLWTLVPGSDATHFKLKSKRGFFAYWDTGASVFKTTANESNASEFRYINRGSYRPGFKQLVASDGTNDISICRYASNEWGHIVNSTSNAGYVRFARLKPTAAHIIYYRDEGIDNTNPQASTTRHYLTYSGTTNNSSADWRESTVSSRKSIIPSDKSLWTLPTAAAYHQDGLWALEESGTGGEFYIKRYGTDQYMNAVMLSDNKCISELGTKDDNAGKYKLADPTVNRYTPIQNVQYQTSSLTKGMFYNWNGYGANANQGSQANDVTFNVGNDAVLGGDALVVGTGEVNYLKYADLSSYSDMIINGTPDMELRVLMSRQTDNNGPLAEKTVTIGSNGTAVVDLTNLVLNLDNNHYLQTQTGSASVRMTYVNGNDDAVNTSYGQISAGNAAYCGYNKIANGTVELVNKGWGVNNITYLEVDASAISGTISRVTLTGDFQQLAARNLKYGVGYNSTAWSSTMTWNNADRSITKLGDEQTVDIVNYDKQLTFDITSAFTTTGNKKMTILVYQTAAGGGYIKNPTVSVDYTPNEVSFAHLNAIKTTNNSPGGTINSITLERNNTRYLHHSAGGDGWQVSQWTNQYNDIWNAGFYPVEVPEPNKDEFFQVRLVLNPPTEESRQPIPLTGGDITPSGTKYTPTGDLQRCFRHQNLQVPSGYDKIVVRFAEPVVGSGWNINGVVNGDQTYGAIPEGSLYYEMDLNINGTPVSSINDFTIFNWYGERNPISIAEVYFYKGNMVASNGCSTSSSEGFPVLWQLDQENDYRAFRLKNSVGECLNGNCSTTSDANNANAIYTNERLLNDFSLKWYVPVLREIPVEQWVRHKESYLKEYTKSYYDQEKLKRQGLITDPDSEWKIFGDYLDGFIQNVNVFEITHYVKKGKTMEIEFPTVLNTNNDHVLYQRFYRYDENEMNMDLDNLKAHVSLDTRQDGNVQYFLYKNGMVTGLKLDWKYNDSTPIPAGGVVRRALRRFNFTNSDGQKFDVAVDVSRYSDLKYLNESSHLDGDLKEPSLTMRYIFHMNDAKDMARELMACTESSGKWKDKVKEIHFPAKRLSYEDQKNPVYQGEFLSLRHVFRDYWVFDDPDYATKYSDAELENHLVPAEKDNSSGRIKVEIQNNTAGITLGGHKVDGVAQGYYHYDEGAGKNQYGDSRFMVFKYPSNGVVTKPNENTPASADLCAFFVDDNGNRYQICKYHIIFDTEVDSETKRWTVVKDTKRDPNTLRVEKGKPIAKISFDYPDRSTGEHADPDRNFYHTPNTGQTYHNLVAVTEGHILDPSSEIGNSSPIPLPFSTKSSNTNYSFDGYDCSWGSYALISQSQTLYGYNKPVYPANTFRTVNDNNVGYAIKSDEGMQDGFLYIDASEQPGDICSISFQGEFCPSDKLFCSGWISGANSAATDGFRCPGGITLTMKGENDNGGTEDIYRFCPGQCYELNYEGTCVEWQQFYFEFSIPKKYRRYWMEVNNNCVSSNGGDFMLDNIEIYTTVPEVVPQINTPLCVSVDENGDPVSDMRLLRLDVDYNKLKASANLNSEAETAKVGFVFLDKEKFLTKLRETKPVSQIAYYHDLGLVDYPDMETMTNDILEGRLILDNLDHAYQAAFDAALLGDKKVWDSSRPSVNMGAGVMYFVWNTTFENNPEYSFAKAVNKQGAVFRYVDEDSYPWLVLNGNYPGLKWKTNTDYFIVPTNAQVDADNMVRSIYELFNICSQCSRASVFQIEPPYELLGLEKSENSEDYMVCEGQIPTLVTNLKGYDLEGNEVPMNDINYDWWLGDKANGVLPTLAAYHAQEKDGVRLDRALATLRIYYPELTSLDGITGHAAEGGNPALTPAMVSYLKELVDAGQLVLHQKSISIPAEPAAADDPYFYLVACPIHDGYFDKALNPDANEYVAYFCDEPQGLRVKIGQKAPTLKTGFVPNQNGFTAYNYPADDPILSIRLAKRAQFMTVQHGESTETPVSDPATAANDLHFLWLPVRDAQTQTADGVIRKSDDYNIYLASTNDPVWDRNIYTSMKSGALPVVGKIVSLYAKNTYAEDADDAAALIAAQNDVNRLCVYFTKNFEVREGYTYTLSLPFQEEGDVNTCDGTMLINLKIVPDYEVWTGGADNTDWNNDQNWRRADGNTAMPTTEPTDESKLNNNELLVSNTLPEESGLYQYKTNYWNYRTAKDRLLRKGFAPLYCTHILMKANEWGDAPVLYDALNGKDDLEAYPFPNLNENYTVNSFEYIGERFESVDALNGKAFAIVNEAEGKVIYGTNVQNLGYGNYPTAMQEGNSGYYYTLESAAGAYLLRLQTPTGNNYEFDAWGRHWDGYLNSQPLTGTVSFVLGLEGWDNIAGRYGMDGQNLGLWTIEENGGKFALKNVGTGKYLKDNSVAKYDEPTYFTFCTLEEKVVPTMQTKYNILKFDMQARVYDIWSDTYGSNPDRGRSGDLIAEMYQINSCDEIAFQPSAELLNAHLLNYNNAWVEYQLDNERWYLLGSPLQGTVAGEWYAPTGTAQQKTTYYEPVTFGSGYDRYSPAIYQRSWDKAKAVLYEVGSTYSTSDDSQTENLGNDDEGVWTDGTWTVPGGGTADQYLDRLGYKPMGGKKANVAIKGVWSNTYNDATVDYANGGFSVMVKNALKNNDQSGGKALIRLPKEDTMYDYYKFEETGQADGGTDTDLGTVQTVKNRALNRGRLKSDLLLPTSNTSLPLYQQIQRTETAASRYGDQRTYTRVPTQKGTDALPMTLQEMQETVATGVSDMGYYLVENPFQTGLDMERFFEENTQLLPKYWILTPTGQQLVYRAADGEWIAQTGQPAAFAAADAKVAPGQGFFVQKDPETTDDAPNAISFTADMQAKTRYGVKTKEETFTIVVGTKQKMTTKEETITMDDGSTQTVTVEVPEVDDSGNYVVEDITEDITISSYEQATGDGFVFPLKARRTRADADEQPGLVVTAQRGSNTSSALVMMSAEASDDFLPSEDTETFISMDELKQVPTVYTLCGRLATTINSIREFRCLPLGVESNSDAPCTLTFQGVEMLGDSVAFYDALERKLTPLESGMKFTVSGQTQNRYYIVSSLNEEEVAEETHLQIFTEGRTAKVIASTAEPINDVRCFDAAGRLVHSASPQTMEYSFTLPDDGIYIIEAKTEKDRKTKKVAVK